MWTPYRKYQILKTYLINECVDVITKNYLDIYNLIRDNTDPGIILSLKICNDEFIVEMSSVEKLKEKNDYKQQIDIKIVNPDEVVLNTPLKRNKPHFLGTKTEVLVAEVIKIVFVRL